MMPSRLQEQGILRLFLLFRRLFRSTPKPNSAFYDIAIILDLNFVLVLIDTRDRVRNVIILGNIVKFPFLFSPIKPFYWLFNFEFDVVKYD